MNSTEEYPTITYVEDMLRSPLKYLGLTKKIVDTKYLMINNEMVEKEVLHSPALIQAFDELLVNAADNKQNDPKMSMIKIFIDKNKISVYNDGRGIKIYKRMVDGVEMYSPEIIFSVPLTSSNYEVKKERNTGGSNGIGGKICNVYSKMFTVETCFKQESNKAIYYTKTWYDNMSRSDKCVIKEFDTSEFTCITYVPDLKRFETESLNSDIVSLFYKRAHDIAGCMGLKVYFNTYADYGKYTELISITSFEKYIELYTKERIYFDKGNKWDFGITLSKNFKYEMISFVNCVRCNVECKPIVDLICTEILQSFKKNELVNTIKDVKKHLRIFINCKISNPKFAELTKLTCKNDLLEDIDLVLSPKFLKKLSSKTSEIVKRIEEYSEENNQKKLNSNNALMLKRDKKKKFIKIEKLEDAINAGTNKSDKCTIILTEGDSAKAFVVAGLSKIGREYFGVFPLKGKSLNVRDKSDNNIDENEEIQNLYRIIGLDRSKTYDTKEEFLTLRYGKVMIMSDQDPDGYHIKGLIINFFHKLWPSLIQTQNFIETFITPLIKVNKGLQKLQFFSSAEYNNWKKVTPNWNQFHIKYYKGLGTSTNQEAKEYFSNIDMYRKYFEYVDNNDDKAIEMAFLKKMSKERKEVILAEYKKNKLSDISDCLESYLFNISIKSATYKDFISKELILFWILNNDRMIPSAIDGLKRSQRKILYTALKRNDKNEVKVPRLSGSVSEMTAYHHGEESLSEAIIKMAQDYTGSNNINLLLPIGQFGSRQQNGDNAADPKYIYTKLNPLTRCLFPVSDDKILTYLTEESQKIEPNYFCPIIPTVLINGSNGIATGFSSNVPMYDPLLIVENVKNMIENKPLITMFPWYRGFKGDYFIGTQIIMTGRINIVKSVKNIIFLEIIELPLKYSIQKYKEYLIEMVESNDIEKFTEYHSDSEIKFIIEVEKDKYKEIENIYKHFKLYETISTSNMHLFDSNNILRIFKTVNEILEDFFIVRKQKYIERKASIEELLTLQSVKLNNQARFINEKIEGLIIIENKSKQHIIDTLISRKYDPSKDSNDYEYLYSMQLIRLSEEERNKLLKEKDDKIEELEQIKNKTWRDLWLADLDLFLQSYCKIPRSEDYVDSGDYLEPDMNFLQSKDIIFKKR
uniref:DNA topoisomerase (ATP-hydrolyzing) n=1 Tax=viral metagenome TaxID=1070528 RepID=A0A6C0JPF6_9ZZZZ